MDGGDAMKYSLLENGLDFIISGILHLQKAEQENIQENIQDKELKYALLHLSSGIELVFKSRLIIEHWTYIFEDMNKASKKSYKEGSLKSVDSNTAIDRLERMCDYHFDDKQKKYLMSLRNARNRFEHGDIDNNPKAIESIINNAIKVIVDFFEKNYDEFQMPSNINLSSDYEGLTDREKDYYKKLTEAIKGLKSHHDDAVKLALARALEVTSKEDLIECPECGEKLLRLGDKLVLYEDNEEKCQCYFCGYSDESKNVAMNYIENVLNISEYEVGHHGGEFPLYTCPDCFCESMIKENDKYFCINCGMKYNLCDLRKCNSCGELFYPLHDEFICENCIERLHNKE